MALKARLWLGALSLKAGIRKPGFEFSRIHYGMVLLHSCSHSHSSQKTPSCCFPTIPTLQDPHRLPLGIFSWFYSFQLDFPAAFPDFPSSTGFADGRGIPAPLRDSRIPTSALEFWLPMATSSFPGALLCLTRNCQGVGREQKFLKNPFPSQIQQFLFFPRRKSEFLWIPDLQAPPIPFFPFIFFHLRLKIP